MRQGKPGSVRALPLSTLLLKKPPRKQKRATHEDDVTAAPPSLKALDTAPTSDETRAIHIDGRFKIEFQTIKQVDLNIWPVWSPWVGADARFHPAPFFSPTDHGFLPQERCRALRFPYQYLRLDMHESKPASVRALPFSTLKALDTAPTSDIRRHLFSASAAAASSKENITLGNRGVNEKEVDRGFGTNLGILYSKQLSLQHDICILPSPDMAGLLAPGNHAFEMLRVY
ncbi:hypothetical protein MMC22_001789 [Lobaria immixta]|nr:hypothetical protein [Lobaria immixta]